MSRFGDLLGGAAPAPAPAAPEPPKVEAVEVPEPVELVVEVPTPVEEEVLEPVAAEPPKTSGKTFRGKKRKKFWPIFKPSTGGPETPFLVL